MKSKGNVELFRHGEKVIEIGEGNRRTCVFLSFRVIMGGQFEEGLESGGKGRWVL